MIFTFRDNTFLNYKNHWFIWESAWDAYRPIDSLYWNGSKFIIDDNQYVSDPLSDTYGYGSEKMVEVCTELTSKFPKDDAKKVHFLPIGNVEWFFDRAISLSPCASRDKESWKKMTNGYHRTLRKCARNRFTKRNSILYNEI